MSAGGLKLFLGELVGTINDLPKSSLLRKESNLEPHTFKFTPTELYNTLLKAQKPYTSSGWKLDADDKTHMKELCFKHGAVLTAEIKKIGGKGLGKGGVVFEFTTSTDVGAEKLSPQMQALKDKGIVVPHEDDVFQKIKTSYYDSITAMFQELQEYFAGQDTLNKHGKKRGFRDRGGKGGLAKEAGSVLEAGHEHGAGIAETTLKKCWDQAFEMHKAALAKSGIKSVKALKGRLKKLGFNLSVIRDNDGEGFVIRLEDRGGNKAEGLLVKDLKQEFILACNKTIEKIDVGKIKSSDSIIVKNRKLIVSEIAKNFKRLKKVKVTTEDTKIKTSKAGAETTSLGQKKTKGASSIDLAGSLSIRATRKKKRKPSPPRMALKNILGLINAKLPQTVADNMGSPRLENQTGRFAQSVRAIDVQDTAKGFKSVGYTYEKDPYQAFESTSGTRFSSAARDPRTLIDFSIREIVAQFGLGRLYTRRL
jgi:hypothetical protein